MSKTGPSVRPAWLRTRLAHETAGKVNVRLTQEDQAFAWLYHHAPTALRYRLYALIQQHPCACLACDQARAASPLEGASLRTKLRELGVTLPEPCARPSPSRR